MNPGDTAAVQTTCHYSTLGLPVDASAEQITAAYASSLARFRRRLAAGNPLPAEHLDAVREAYRTLSSTISRAAYDHARRQDSVSSTIPREAVAAGSQQAAVEFRGSGEEYLRIWLVNIAFTLLTLGIYSAWAKVRREQYFHRNLVVDGSSFQYHGTPRAILAGRIVLFLLLALWGLAEHLGTTARLVVGAAGVAAFPWLLVRSMQFRARNTSYRGIRFNFTGTYRQALTLCVLHGGLVLLTLGLYFPAFLRQQKAFVVRNLHFGTTQCSFDVGAAAFYRGLMFPMILWLLLPGLLFAGIVIIAASAGKAAKIVLLFMLPPLLVTSLAFFTLVLAPYVHVVGTNLLWNNARLGETGFESTQKAMPYLAIVLSNWLLTILTLGFFWPLAQIRLARYRARNLRVLATNGLAEALARNAEAPAALGGEAVGAFDMDIAL